MSWRMPAEYGAISTLAANHRMLSEISQRVSRLLPTSSAHENGERERQHRCDYPRVGAQIVEDIPRRH